MTKYFKSLLILLSSLLINVSCSKTQEYQEMTEVKRRTVLDYEESYRNQIHFSPQANWMNDPNGLVFYEGEYHLFYQYYPDSTVWGPMHWGHAISTDLINWEHLPIALYPDDFGYIFSGSAVVDRNNTSGLGSEDNPAMVAIFTYHLMEGEKAGAIDYQTQGIAYSMDKGRTWTKYEGNPVIPNPGIRDFRDPKVSWSKDYQKWIMALAVTDHISFYSSQNLIEWEFETINNPSSLRMTGEEYRGIYDSDELKEIYFKYRDLGQTGDLSQIIIINYNLDYDNKTGMIHSFIGVQNEKTKSIRKAEFREISPSKIIRVELQAHNAVIPSPERVLEKAREYSIIHNLVLGNYVIERYRSEWLTIIEFPVSGNEMQ